MRRFLNCIWRGIETFPCIICGRLAFGGIYCRRCLDSVKK
jgi:hypothetical protein